MKSEVRAIPLPLESGPAAAIRRTPAINELFYYYQPILATDRNPVIYEALVRWRNPEGLILPPVHFLQDLLDSGESKLAAFTSHTIDSAARTLHDHKELPRLSINLSPSQICRHETLSQLESLHERLRQRLMIEVTENCLPSREAYSLWLGETAALGIDLVLDDLVPLDVSSRLPPQLPIEGVKFDRSLLGKLLESAPDTELIQIVHDLKRLKLSLTAEGLDSPDQMAPLSALGFDRFQGFGLGMPVPLFNR